MHLNSLPGAPDQYDNDQQFRLRSATLRLQQMQGDQDYNERNSEVRNMVRGAEDAGKPTRLPQDEINCRRPAGIQFLRGNAGH